jgi:CBS domain-containing protein
MITDFATLDSRQTLQDAAKLVIAGSQRDFPVLENGALVGVLTRGALVSALAERGLPTSIQEVMSRRFDTVEAREMLETAFIRLQNCDCHVLPVLLDGHLVGLLTPDNIGEFVMIQTALRQGR